MEIGKGIKRRERWRREKRRESRKKEGGWRENSIEKEKGWETFWEEDTETDRNSRSGEPVRHRRRSVFTQCEILVR